MRMQPRKNGERQTPAVRNAAIDGPERRALKK
jgi:hypothetical protein